MIHHEVRTELDQWSSYQIKKKKNTIMIKNIKPRLNLRENQ